MKGVVLKTAYKLGFGSSENELTLSDLPITGTFPDWLTGTLFRNGPGTFQVGQQRYRHWFDGLAMLHKFSFRNGTVSYANRYLDCKAYRSARTEGKITYSEFATDPCHSILGRAKAVFSPKLTDSAKVNITRLEARYFALGETPMQIEFDPETLKSIGVLSYEPNTRTHVTTVHPQFDPHTGMAVNLVTHFGRISEYRFYQISPSAGSRRIASVRVKQPAYLHSFGMSEHYIILAEFPLVVNPLALLFQARPFIENYHWKPERGTRFLILNRQTGQLVSEQTTDAFFAFHHVNAIEENDRLLVDLVSYPNPDIISAFYLDTIESERSKLPTGTLTRYELNPNSDGPVQRTALAPAGLELPRYDEDQMVWKRTYRAVYGVGVRDSGKSSFYDQLVKNDIKTGSSAVWNEPGCYPGEGVFVGHPERQREDEGVVLSVVLNETTGTSFLLALDAESFTEIGRAELPHPVLFGYHGAYHS
jgi:carotenoid cleavage dioxygenase-like enzyme